MSNLHSYLIKSNLPISGMHWGVEFKAGVASTEDVALANKLIRKGYAVTCVSEPKEQPAPAPPATPAEPEKTEEPEQPAETPTPKPTAKAAAPKGAKKAKKG